MEIKIKTKQKLNTEKLLELREKGYSYKEIIDLTGYNKNSVYGFFIRTYGVLEDRNESRRQIIPITDIQKEILFGTLMGDCSIQKVNNSYQSRTNHSIKQIKYAEHKVKQLDILTYGLKISGDKQSIKYPKCYFCLKPNEKLKEFYNMFYLNGKKIIPENLSLLTPRAMAYWFMDDGTSTNKCTISIATCCFELNDLIRLKEFLKNTYSLDVTINKEFKIIFKAESGRKFYNLVKEFIIEEMMYKFKDLNF